MLSIRDLSLVVDEESGPRPVVHNLDLAVTKGQTMALVGESGSGKTLIALAVLGLLPSPPIRIVSGAIEFDGTNLFTLDERELSELRGNRIAMVFQEPGTALDPLMTVGPQIAEVIRRHKGLGRRVAKEQALALMEMVGIPDPERRYRGYPHQLSGGIRQRVMIATALACRPDLLLADEPTSALDATVQAQIVDLLSRLIRDLGMSVLLITHDLGVVAALADRIAVLLDGRIVEEGSPRQILKEPIHPYTQALIAVQPHLASSFPSGRLAEIDTASFLGAETLRCSFAAACPRVKKICRLEAPELVDIGTNHKVRCFVPGDVDV